MPLTHRERLLGTVLGRPVDRPPFWLYWGPWYTTWERWRREGMPARFQSFADVQADFGADPVPRVVSVKMGPLPDFTATVSEDAESVTCIDSWGIRRRNLKGKHQRQRSEFGGYRGP